MYMNHRMSWRSAAAAGFLAIAVIRGASGQVVSASRPDCLSPSRLSTDLRDEFEDLMTRPDSIAADVLAIYDVKRVSPSAVTAIHDSKVCKAASIAYARAVNAEVSAVHVIKVGPRYVVVSPDIVAGEWKTVVTFNSSFTKSLAKVAY